ncbi:WecB/TagA/CpsF family glycosyltransferase [Nibrella viscosa]|uniref:WecB/TagA/CpsF family glycosyltransferase n=1 Tax=Nibrella viscosa TaxID=1084524 RepID=A0ABP8KUU6_9BACT
MEKTYTDSTRIRLLDYTIDAISPAALFERIDDFVERKAAVGTIGYTNLHGLYVAVRDKTMAQFYRQADINYIDGMPITWLARGLGYPVSNKDRITFLDFYYDFFVHCRQQKYRVLWIGGVDESQRTGIEKIKALVPGVELVGIDGFRPDDEYLAIAEQVKPHVILLGLGMPRQESWILRNKALVHCQVIWCVGATIDYIAGKVITPPRWAAKRGFEWLFRLIAEPHRMWFRYMVEPVVVLCHIAFSRRHFIN